MWAVYKAHKVKALWASPTLSPRFITETDRCRWVLVLGVYIKC